MSVVKISLGALSDAERKMICKKLSNLDEITPIPIMIADSDLLIGFGPETEEPEVWGDLYEKLGYRAHCV